MLTYTYTTRRPRQIVRSSATEKVDRIVSVDHVTRARTGREMHRFGQVQESGGAYRPACGYASMQKVIHPSPAHPGG